MTSSPLVCQGYANGSYTPGCHGGEFGGGLPLILIPVLIAPTVILVIILGVRVWKEGALTRGWWNKRGTKAMITYKAGPGVPGIVTEFIPKMWLFESNDKKRERMTRLFPMVQGAVTHLGPQYGGETFVYLDGDKGAPISAPLCKFAQEKLNEFSESHDWSSFALKMRYAEIVELRRLVAKFPLVKDWNPGTDTVTLVNGSGEEQTKLAKDCTPLERDWYVRTSSRFEAQRQDAEADEPRVLAALHGESSYRKPGAPEDTPLLPRDKTELVEKITHALASREGLAADAVLGGSAVSKEYVANVLDNVPNGVYFDGALAKIEKKVRDGLKNEKLDMKQVLMIIGLVGGLAVILVVAVRAL